MALELIVDPGDCAKFLLSPTDQFILFQGNVRLFGPGGMANGRPAICLWLATSLRPAASLRLA